MVIAVGFSYFDRPESVKRAMDSFADMTDYNICIYGKYDDMEADPDEFLASKLLCESYPNVISRTYHGTEHDKRNVYLEECERLGVDILLIIDSDEWIEGDWNLFRNNLADMIESNPDQAIMGMKGTINRKGDYSFYPKIWINPASQRYYKSHCVVRQGNRIYHPKSKDSQKYLVDGLTVWHNDDLRGKDLTQRIYRYQKQLMLNEKEVREKYK